MKQKNVISCWNEISLWIRKERDTERKYIRTYTKLDLDSFQRKLYSQKEEREGERSNFSSWDFGDVEIKDGSQGVEGLGVGLRRGQEVRFC